MSLLTDVPTAYDINILMRDLFDNHSMKDLVWGFYLSEVFYQDHVHLFGKEVDGKLVSLVTLYTVKLFSRRLGVVEEVVTLKKYRNLGYSTELVKEALDKARELKLNCVELTVREDRPTVQKFYEGLGFFDRKNKSMRINL